MAPSSEQPTNPTPPASVKAANRSSASTPLPLPSNNFASLGYTFILLDENSHPLQEILLAVAPEDFQQVETSTSNVIMTAGDAYTDSFGPGLTQITLSGTFGNRPTGNSLVSSVSNQPLSSGQYLVLQLRDMFRKYLDRLNPIITPDAKKNINTTLQFYNPKDNEFWNIEPIGNWFVLSRSKSSPFLYRYKLTFVCTGRARSGSILGAQDLQSFRNNVVNTISDTYGKLANTLSSIGSYAGGFISAANQIGVASENLSTFLTTPLASLQSAVNTYLSYSSTVIDYPLASIDNIRGSISDFYTTYEDSVFSDTITSTNPLYPYTGPYTVPVIDPYVDYQFTQVVKALDSYQLNSNAFSKTFIKSDFVSQSSSADPSLSYIDLNNVQSVTYYQIRGGDTIEGISLTTLGDSRYWKSLAEFNGLAYPYVSSIKPKPDRTLGPGDTIAIPNTQEISTLTNIVLGASTPNSKDPMFALGTDFALDGTSDIPLVGGDLLTVAGVPNVKQALFLKLNVHRGELYLHPFYGMTDLRGYRTTALLAAKASAEFHDTLISDSRVGSVTNAQITVDSDVLNYSSEVGIKLTNQPITLEGSLGLSK